MCLLAYNLRADKPSCTKFDKTISLVQEEIIIGSEDWENILSLIIVVGVFSVA